MTRPSRPEVRDDKLRAALDRVGDHIENFAANLDAISHDINKIEEYLTNSGIRLGAGVQIGHEELFNPEDHLVHNTVQRIAWRPADDEGTAARWRLMYIENNWETVPAGEFAPRANDEPDRVQLKPLIETPVAVRLLAHRHLPALITAVAERVEVRPLLSLIDDDIPL